MKVFTSVLAALILSLPLGNFTGSASAASAGKGNVNRGGGKATERMSDKGALNTNGQWSADPDRGWVRANERNNKMHEKGGSSDRIKQNHGKQKGKGKANKP